MRSSVLPSRPYGFSEEQLQSYRRPYDDVMRYAAARFPYTQFHFGKNTREHFVLPGHRANTAERLARFQSVVDRWDPYGVFANAYLEDVGLTWPRRGQPFAPVYIRGDVATSAHTRVGTLFAVQSKSSGRCLTMVGEPGLLLDGSFFGQHGAETRDCSGALAEEDPRMRFFERDVASGQFVERLEAQRRYSIHPEDSPFAMCLDSLWGIDYHFAPCNGSTAQQFKLALDASGVTRVSAQNNPAGGCMTDAWLGDGISASSCNPLGGASPSLLWSVKPVGARRMPRVAGLGGDPYWIDRLAVEGLDLSQVGGRRPPRSLRASPTRATWCTGSVSSTTPTALPRPTSRCARSTQGARR